MPNPAPRTRDQLRHYATTYEVVAVIPGHEPIRLGFTERPSKIAFIRMAQDHATLLLLHIGENDSVSYTAAGGLRLGAITIRRSGRTERECAGAPSCPPLVETFAPRIPDVHDPHVR